MIITREIGIDMGHRVEAHGSKCRNLHGHRYRIEASISGKLVESGEEAGMVMDFGFLKEEMMLTIDTLCDHGMMLNVTDNIAIRAMGPQWQTVYKSVEKFGYFSTSCDTFGKLMLVPFTPTAENIAKLWFNWLDTAVRQRTQGRAAMVSIKVWETPNCSVVYP